MSAGLDSLGSVEFANVLAQKLGMQMPGTLVFDYPSVAAVTEYLTAQLLKSAAAAAPAAGEGGLLATEGSEEFYGLDEAEGELRLAVASPASRYLAVLAVVARPLLAGTAGPAEPAAVGSVADQITKVPLQRWDLDIAEQLCGDPSALSAQVGSAVVLDAAAMPHIRF